MRHSCSVHHDYLAWIEKKKTVLIPDESLNSIRPINDHDLLRYKRGYIILLIVNSLKFYVMRKFWYRSCPCYYKNFDFFFFFYDEFSKSWVEIKLVDYILIILVSVTRFCKIFFSRTLLAFQIFFDCIFQAISCTLLALCKLYAE